MKDFGSVDDVLDFAIENEIRAQNFYTDLAARMERPAMSSVFEEFAKEEVKHEKLLRDVKAGHKLDSVEEKVKDLKIADYLVDASPSAEMTYQDALILAMKREKAAYTLYHDLTTKLEDEQLIKLFTMLANEEAKHKLRFEIEYDEAILREN